MNDKIIENGTIKNQIIKKNMRLLLSKFITIRRQGYIKSKFKGSVGVGLTFENYLGQKANSHCTPDYHGIEIKTQRAHSKSSITLFSLSPKGPTANETLRLRNTYGYPSPTGATLKCLYSEVTCNSFNKAGAKYYFKLNLDRTHNRLVLQAYNLNKQLISAGSYWELSTIKDRLYTKLTYLAHIRAWCKFISDEEYFKYFDLKFYVLKDFETFLTLLEQGHIKVIIALNSSHKPENYGQLRAHKISFALDPEYLTVLFYRYLVSEDIIL